MEVSSSENHLSPWSIFQHAMFDDTGGYGKWGMIHPIECQQGAIHTSHDWEWCVHTTYYLWGWLGDSLLMFYPHHNVGITIINHPPVITIDCWYKSFPNGWLIIVIPTSYNFIIGQSNKNTTLPGRLGETAHCQASHSWATPQPKFCRQNRRNWWCIHLTNNNTQNIYIYICIYSM